MIAGWSPSQPETWGRCRSYYRTSGDEQKERQTIAAQRRYMRDYCRRRGISMTTDLEYADDGVTGMSEITDRDRGAALIREAMAGEFDTLIVTEVDRLGREAFYILQAFHLLRKAGVVIKSCTEEFDPTEPTGRLLVALLAGKAESERATLLVRTGRGMVDATEEPHRYLGGRVPFGMKLERRRRAQYYVICDDPIPGKEDWTPAQVIRCIFTRVVVDRASCQEVSNELNALLITPCWVPGDTRYDKPSTARWDRQRVALVIRNPFYKGRQQFGSSWREVPALVTPEEWAVAQVRLKENRTRADRNAPQTYPLRGKIVCLNCGGHYTHSPMVSGFMPRGRYYKCAQLQYGAAVSEGVPPGQRPLCHSKWIDAAWIEDWIKAHIEGILSHPEPYLEDLRVAMGRQADQAGDLLREADALDKQRRPLEEERKNYLRLRAQRLIQSDEELGDLLDDVRARDHSLQQRADHLRFQAKSASDSQRQLDANRAVIEEYHARLGEGLTEAEWYDLFQRAVERVEVQTEGRWRKRTVSVKVYIRQRITETVTPGGNPLCYALEIRA